MRTLVVAAALAVSTDAGAKCAQTELRPTLLTPDGTKLPADGGVLVGYESRMPEDYTRPARGLTPSYTAVDGKASVELSARPIAPGVFVYTPKGSGTGPITVMDDKIKIGTFPRGATDKNDLPAPDATKGFVHVENGHRYERLTFNVEVAAVPDAAFAVITYDDRGKAISFEIVPHDKAGKTTILPYVSPPRCSFDPEGTDSPGLGTKVTIAWVDRFGRVGKPSKVITVDGSTPTHKNVDDD
jgi:hypothetical protein